MAGWRQRKSWTVGGVRYTRTYSEKGMTFSRSTGNKSMRFTQSQGPRGNRTTTTLKGSNGWSQSTTTTDTPRKSRIGRGRTRKMTKAEAQMWAALFGSLWFWAVIGISSLIFAMR